MRTPLGWEAQCQYILYVFKHVLGLKRQSGVGSRAGSEPLSNRFNQRINAHFLFGSCMPGDITVVLSMLTVSLEELVLLLGWPERSTVKLNSSAYYQNVQFLQYPRTRQATRYE